MIVILYQEKFVDYQFDYKTGVLQFRNDVIDLEVQISMERFTILDGTICRYNTIKTGLEGLWTYNGVTLNTSGSKFK